MTGYDHKAANKRLSANLFDMIDQRDKALKERDAARTEMLDKNSAAADALNWLWKEIVLSKYPNYGEWDYPNQAARFIKEEHDKLRDELSAIKLGDEI